MRYILVILALLLPLIAYAGDIHFDDETHLIIFTPADSNGNFKRGLTIRLTVKSHDTIGYFDFSDSIWKNTPDVVTQFATMKEDDYGGFYWYPFTVDSVTLVSGDYVFIVSNEDSTFQNVQAESVHFSNLNNLIKIHR